MCEPVSIGLGVAALGVQIAGSVAENKAKKKAANAAKESAVASGKQAIDQLSLRGVQEQQAAGLSLMQADRTARMASADASLAAGEGGVAGQSVDAVLGDINRQESEFKTTTGINLKNTQDQIEMEKAGVRTNVQNQINSVPGPSNLATGLQIGGAVLGFANQLALRSPKARGPK